MEKMNDDVINGLVDDWDDVYKKGQLGVWILLSIYDGRKYTAEIIEFMDKASHGHFAVKEQSLYRALRRFKDMGLVDVTEEQSPNSGPKRKYYELTELGVVVLGKFATLNIRPLLQPQISTLINHLAEEIRHYENNR